MQKIKIPKGYKLNVECHKAEDGPATHLILSKLVSGDIRYFLFEILENNNLNQISTSQTPAKLYQIIWPQT